jgi:hypothetical protein
MTRMLISAIFTLLANAIGLLLAMFFLDGFHIDALSFVIAVLIFTGLQLVLSPIIERISRNNAPALKGGAALITILLGLFITTLLVSGMQIGGLFNWIVGTLIVWIGAVIGGIILPMFMFKNQVEKDKA